MEPNDLPIVCLPTDLSGEEAARLIDFLYQITAGLERLYLGQLMQLRQPSLPPSDETYSETDPPTRDPPF